MDNADRARLNRLRALVLALVVSIIFAAIVAPTAVIVFVGSKTAEVQLEVSCEVLKAEVHQLQAITRNGVLLEEITRNLGLPIVPPPTIPIPEVPPEFDTS